MKGAEMEGESWSHDHIKDGCPWTEKIEPLSKEKDDGREDSFMEEVNRIVWYQPTSGGASRRRGRDADAGQSSHWKKSGHEGGLHPCFKPTTEACALTDNRSSSSFRPPPLFRRIQATDEVPEDMWELLELEKLNLSLNSLKVLPPHLGQLTNLVVPNLWGNQLSSWPAEIGHLRRLRVLFVYRNKLTEVPEELGGCLQLEVLSLANNQLSSLPASLSNLSRLRQLNLSNNRMAHVPGCVCNLMALEDPILMSCT
nr:leucine-rich repeat-containing protein 30-like [Nothobranchius furzeri]